MKEILIDKEIGGSWFEEGITADYVKSELDAAGSDDIKIVIDSAGGDVFDCISIYNTIRDFCRTHTNSVTTYIRGIAASAASVIALAASNANTKNKVIVESNSVFMIHNGLTFCTGNRHELRACADRVEKIADKMMLDVYTKKTCRNPKAIQKEMDDETWFCGQEIINAGFADAMISGDEPNVNNDAFVASAKDAFRKIKIAACANLREQKIAAVAAEAGAGASIETKGIAGAANVAPDKNKMEGCKMTVEELKQNNPELYSAIVADAKASGEQAERERAARLLAMGEKCGCTDYALECIRENKSPSDESVIDAFMDKKVAASVLAAQKADEKEVPEIVLPKDSELKDNDAIMAAFDREFGRSA